MTSSLAALWRYARAEKIEALENFSTEAVAAAIRSDARPFVRLLHEKKLLNTDREPVDLLVVTQKPVASGFVDLAVTLIGPDWTHEVWVEVKVNSGLNGNQIETYLEAIRGRGPQLPTTLAFLTKYRIRPYPYLVRITWEELKVSATAADPRAYLWRDLAAYLEDVGVTDPFNDPVTPSEAAGMLDAARLLRKMRRLLRRAARDARAQWPQLAFPDSTGVADRFVEEQFADHARLTIGTRGGRANVLMGIVQREASVHWSEAEPQVAVWVEHHPKATEVRRLLIEGAASGGLGSDWQRYWKGYWALLRHEPVSKHPDLEEMRAWWFARLEELDAAGIIELLPRLGGRTVEDEAASAEEAVADAQLP